MMVEKLVRLAPIQATILQTKTNHIDTLNPSSLLEIDQY